MNFIEKKTREFVQNSKKTAKKLKIDVEIFIGGSVAKGTLIKKELHDADIFFRFSKKYLGKDLTKEMNKILKENWKKTQIHGSRDYFRIKVSNNFYIEAVPVIKINKPEEKENITDLSYSHVRYIKRKIKENPNVLKEILLSKAFCQAKGIYGAESYIKGFSGYSLELLLIHYKTFENFLKKLSKLTKEKIIIDIEKQYPDKKRILLDINESKLESPIILIDPTHRYRNASAALSEETFRKFKREAKKFLKSPSISHFEPKKTDIDRIRRSAKRSGNEFILVEIKTSKQKGDIAGTKLFKFYNHFLEESKKYFDIKNKGFNYNNEKSARFFVVAKKKKEIIHVGPSAKDPRNVLSYFKKEHKRTFVRRGKLYAKTKPDFSLKAFVKKWSNKNSKKIEEMYIKDLKIID